MSELISQYFEFTHSNWIVLIANVIYFFMWFAVLNRVHRLRFSRPVTLTVEFLFNLLVINIASRLMPFMSVLRSFLGYALLFGFCFIIYRDSRLKVSLTLSLLMILNIFNELLGAVTYFPEAAMDGTPELMSSAELLRFYGPYLAIGGLSCLLLYTFLRHVIFRLDVRDCALLILFPFSQYMLMTGWLKLLTMDGTTSLSLFFAAAIVLCLSADLALFAVIKSVARRAQLESENRRLEQLMEEQGKHYEALTAQYEDIRRMRHDIAKHMNTVESLLHRGESAQAQAYVAEMKEENTENTVFLCQHPVADAFLLSRVKAAAAQGIETKFTGDIRPDIAISSTDLIRCLGNLLDNAYEGCLDAGGSAVSLRCAETGGFLVIITENPSTKTPVKHERRIPGLERGVGTRVLSDIAAKYEGSFSAEENEGVHSARLVLKARKEEP